MRILRVPLVALLLLLPLGHVNAQDDGEVIVIAELNRTEVRQFIEEVEAELYAIFNAANEDEDYDVVCYRMTPTGSNISRRVCEPNFAINARAQNVNDARFGNADLIGESGLRILLSDEYEELTSRMEAMARENPQFAEVAGILTQLQARQAQLQND